jgi:hypothetical protein
MEFDPGFDFGSGFDDFDINEFNFTHMDNFDFANTDIQVDALGSGNLEIGAKFDYKKAFMEAALSIGGQENMSDNFQADSSGSESHRDVVLPPYPSHPNIDTMSESSIGATAGRSSPILSSESTKGVTVPSAPTLPESDGIQVHAHRRPTKRKKVEEVNAAHILPEGLQRIRTKSAKATAALESS